MHSIACSLRVVVLLAASLFLADASRARAEDRPPTARLGKQIEALSFQDAAGKPFALPDLKGKKAVVVVFLSFECPVSTGHAETLAELARTYQARGVAFVGVHGAEEAAAQIEKLAREYRIPFPVYRDEGGKAAEALRAEVVPEAFVLDGDFVLRYRGRIDDRYTARLKQNLRVSRHDLREALDEVLAGKDVSAPATRAVGCPIARSRPAPAATGKVTFHRDVLPILQNHCQECHRPGEVAPFALLTYRQAVNWAGDIKEYTQLRKMPPWKPVEGLPMHGERRLTDREIATLAEWVTGGTPEGDPAAAPVSRRFPEGWQLGQPDLVLIVDEDFQLGASGPDLYRCFVLPTNLPEDRHVTAVEVRPGNRRVVHHAALFPDSTGQGRKLAERKDGKNQGKDDRGPGYSLPLALSFMPGFLPQSGLGGWTPGLVIRHFPQGTGFVLPRGADVVMQVHYHRSGRIETDRTSVGLYFARKPVERAVQAVGVLGQFLFIPAGKERYQVVGSSWVRQDCHLHTVMPHMHLLGREIKITMVTPEGKPRTLLAVKDWDFYWQELYFFKDPVPVKAGTRFDIEAIYDNSAGNPNNPNRPPRNVYFGLETTDEMCLGVFGATADKPGRLRFEVQPRIPGLNWGPSWGIPLPGI
jgi:peroxiredoxin/mono/diheme cytochrome c family protein